MLAIRDYDRYEAFLRYEFEGVRNEISVDAGYSEVEFDFDGEGGDGTVFRLAWTRTISEFATLTVGGGTRFSDQGDIFRLRQNSNPDITETEDVLGIASPFQNDFADARYTLARPRYGLSLFVTWSDENYIENPLADRRLIRGGITMNRNLTRKISGTIGFDYYVRDFLGLGREDKDSRVVLAFGYEFNPAFDTSLDIIYTDRSSTLAADEYDETRVFLTFSYTPKWGR